MVNYPEKGVYELIECKDNHHWPESVKTDMHGILPGQILYLEYAIMKCLNLIGDLDHLEPPSVNSTCESTAQGRGYILNNNVVYEYIKKSVDKNIKLLYET